MALTVMHNLRKQTRWVAQQTLSGVLITLLTVATPISVAAETAIPATNDNTQTNQPAPAVSVPVDSTSILPISVPPLQLAPTTDPAPSTPAEAPANKSADTKNDDKGPATSSTTTTNPNNTKTTSVTNTTNSDATSGNAAVTENHRAGDAASGKATATATIVNVVGHNSTTGIGTPTTFVRDIYNSPGSNVIQGNIMIDPGMLMPASGSGVVTTTAGLDSLTNIENNVTLTAVSGNADVNGNYKAGSATTGDATAMANIINVVNSSVGARNTFLGVVNIYGNLRGDILVPSTLVDSLFGSNSTTPATTTTSTNANTSEPGSINTNVNIQNNVDLAATSGDATVQDNYKAGDATSGDATTKLTVFNLTGQTVVAKNSLLVFVNVLGSWVGMIVNAPAGATAAALTGAGTGSPSTPTDATPSVAGDVNSTVNITNNVKVSATSGNATVQDNYKAGSATSGNAQAGANILNLVHTSFSLDDWFGILFINVLGSWLGNFGIETTTPPPATGEPATPVTPSVNNSSVKEVKVFRFNSSTSIKAPSQPAFRNLGNNELNTVAATKPAETGEVLSAQDSNPNSLPQSDTHQSNAAFAVTLSLLGLVLILAALLRRRQINAAKSA